ncbi:ras-associated and pleckstrin homology domains-containing protein 1-like isoform X2 [Photinus pyralis]|uniref:ras-associated and pleckstrin homology domains-containing protein 1-like isoform X2 n=1 Tax=Photinus pyralis TaxID=7054 RepID=UPI0012677C97|nr:ras-associated and pleckstrin homology domains-containing protein 1-like isoform X2 [Photinus pyralis]
MFCGGSFRSKTIEENDEYRIVTVNNTQIKLLRSKSFTTTFTRPVGGRKIFAAPLKVQNESTTKRVCLSPERGLDSVSSSGQLRPLNAEISAPRIDSYRFSMANLEDSQDVDLDAILGELCALETQCEREIGNARDKRISDLPKQAHQSRTHTRSCSEGPRLKLDPGESDLMLKTDSGRTDSPDNDSAFSDTVSMLSSESSASSGGGGPKPQTLQLPSQSGQDEASRAKSEKIRMAMEKIKEANIQKLFVKVFTVDGSAKSLLVDEKMICAYITRLLADKNHVQMDPKWAIVEHLPDLYMERVYEDHELLVDNLMLWTRDSKNKIYFAERPDKTLLFSQPEKFLLSSSDKRDNTDYDEHSRSMLLEEFFASTSQTIPQVEGPLYLKSDSKKGWKKYHFVLRASGLYYFQKEKPKTTKDLICLTTFDVNQVYYGLGWKKKYKAPTDHCFAIKHPRLQEPKSTKYIKYLCAEDMYTLERWVIGIRIAKHGRQLMDNYRMLMDELAQEDLDKLAHARSCSVSSIAVQSNATTPTQNNPTHSEVLPRVECFRYSGSEGYGTQSDTYSALSEVSSGRHSRASSSSSSGCMSDGAPSSCENAFESEFPMGTIKRKPSMKPSLPLTNITRQLKEVGETREEGESTPLPSSPVSYTNSGTLTRLHNRRKSSNSTDDSSNSGTLKRQHSYKSRGSIESMSGRGGNSSPLCGTPIRERASPFGDREKVSPFSERPPSSNSIRSPVSVNNGDMPSSMMDSITSLPPPPDSTEDLSLTDSTSYQLPPPPPEVYNSNLSLDSLPPPPNPSDLPPLTGSELTGSQLSLMSLPPPPSENGDTDTVRRRKESTTPTSVFSPERTPTQSPDLTPTHSRLNTPCFSPPPLSIGSNSSTPTRTNPPVSFSPTSHIPETYSSNNSQNVVNGQNYDRHPSNQIPPQPPAYMNPPPYRQNSTLPNSTVAFNNTNGLRSSLRQTSLPRQVSVNSIASSNSSSSSGGTIYAMSPHMTDLQKKNAAVSPQPQRKVNFQEPTSPKKLTKKISFNLIPQEAPALPKKPPPPVRSENTKLSSPKKLVEPPKDFLKDLQRVMRKKWQIAQKCKLEPSTTPHEVLGFRDPVPLLPEYKESNVSRWVKEHYGCNNYYENIYTDNVENVVEYASSPLHMPKDASRSKRPPPPPPKRSETTQLSTPRIH